MSDYHRGHEVWWANSKYLDIGDAVPPCNVAYYVKGGEFVVTELKLVLNVNAPDETDLAYGHFFQVVSTLANAAIPGALRNGKVLEIPADDAPLLVNGYALSLQRIDWPKGIPGGHELAFVIEVADTPASASDAPAHRHAS